MNRAARRAFWPWLAVLLWAALIFALSSIPGEDIPELGIPNIDKLAHFMEFFVFSALLANAFMNSFAGFSLGKIAILSIIISVLYAIIDEAHQRFISDRTPDILDIIADLAGSCSYIGVFIYRKIKVWRR